MENGSLWIVATPIGTLADFSTRAVEILAAADLILAEDTRRVRRLLSHVGVAAGGRLRSFHEHNEKQRVDGVVERLAAGDRVALLSDAGTPALSDPGFLLVRRVRELGLKLCSVPGPSAFSTALAASGQAPLPATLVGFLPPRRGARQRKIAEFGALGWTLVFLLSPHRLEAELSDLRDQLGGDRPATLLAELSKLHERAEFGALAAIASGDEVAAPRGEYVLVVGPKEEGSTVPPEADGELVRQSFAAAIAAGSERKDALRATARKHGLSRREVYELVLGRHKPSV